MLQQDRQVDVCFLQSFKAELFSPQSVQYLLVRLLALTSSHWLHLGSAISTDQVLVLIEHVPGFN